MRIQVNSATKPNPQPVAVYEADSNILTYMNNYLGAQLISYEVGASWDKRLEATRDGDLKLYPGDTITITF